VTTVTSVTVRIMVTYLTKITIAITRTMVMLITKTPTNKVFSHVKMSVFPNFNHNWRMLPNFGENHHYRNSRMGFELFDEGSWKDTHDIGRTDMTQLIVALFMCPMIHTSMMTTGTGKVKPSQLRVSHPVVVYV